MDKVKRSESGMIVEPVTLPPDALVADALALMARYHISGVPIIDDGRPARRHPHEPRPALRDGHDAARLGADDLARPRHRAGRHDARGGARRSCTGTRSRSCRSSTPTGRLHGPDHGQGHPEADRVPARDEGRAGPAARRRRRRRRPRRARARRGARRRRTSDVLVVDTAHGHSQRRASRWCARLKEPLRRRAHRRQHRDRGGAEALIEAGRGRGQGRGRPGLDLHDARRRRRRRAAGHGDPRLRRGRRAATACR